MSGKNITSVCIINGNLLKMNTANTCSTQE